MTAGAEAWAKGLETWGKMMGLDTAAKEGAEDRRFAAPEWQDNPVFDTIRKTYLALSDQLLGTVEEIEGLDDGIATEDALRRPQLRRRDEPVQLRSDQSAGAQAHDGNAGREPP